jgi:hypothetical protein
MHAAMGERPGGRASINPLRKKEAFEMARRRRCSGFTSEPCPMQPKIQERWAVRKYFLMTRGPIQLSVHIGLFKT